MQLTRLWLICCASLLIIGCAATNSSYVTNNTSELPNVLIIGDSISIGYTPKVREVLAGVANVQRPDENTRDTRIGLKHLDRWLGDTQWDVIHFNWGLHDLCYRHPDSTASGRRDKVNGTISVPLDDYKLNLEDLVRQLEGTGARLIWANTTIVPDGELGRVPGDDLRYNRAAAEIMEHHEIALDDLHTLTSEFDQSLFIRPGNVHYTDDGYAVIAAHVAEQIRLALDGDENQTELAILEESFKNLVSKREAPQAYDVERRPDGLFQLYLDGPPYKSSPTQFFAIYNLPDTPLQSDRITHGKIPAVVLVHGGGGTAFAEWVRRWNDAGFAAIAIAVEGQTDGIVDPSLHGPERWERHSSGGPPRTGIYSDFNEPIADEWMFHAVYAAIQANNFLHDQTEVDPKNVGIVGISWGGVITATTIGFDQRFSFAVPIYGSGYLPAIPNQYAHSLATNPEYAEHWEPALRLHKFATPTLWLTGRAENNFFLPAQAASYRSVGGDVSVSIKPDMRHGHPPGWNAPEPYAFASAVTRNGKSPFVPSEAVVADDGSYVVSFQVSGELSPNAAVAYATPEQVIDPQTNWQEISAKAITVDNDLKTVEVRVQSVPDDTVHWIVNLSLLHEESGQVLIASSRLNSIFEPAAPDDALWPRTLEVKDHASADRPFGAVQAFADGNVRPHRPVDPRQMILVGLVKQIIHAGLESQ